MIRVLLAVGCDAYDLLSTLRGAESDASEITRVLVQPSGDYNGGVSQLLRSPSLTQLRSALSVLPFEGEPIESFTFFFAGHGGVKAGTYYLCVRDTDPARLSTTGLAITALLSVIAELKPLQANVVIDACQSGSAMLDATALLRPDALGLDSPESLGIAFVAACGMSEYATESESGGVLTQSLLRYIRGERTLQTTRPFLDLIDIGRRVSAELQESTYEQLPVSWGINLTGEGRFARNPRATTEATEDELGDISRLLSDSSYDSRTKEVLRAHAFSLWTEHRKLDVEADIPSLLLTLRGLIATFEPDHGKVSHLLRGLATSLRASAVNATDVVAESLVMYACAATLFEFTEGEEANPLGEQLLTEAGHAQARARAWLLQALQSDRFALLSDGNGLADLFYLPLRVSRILGWLAAGLEITRLLGQADVQAEHEVKEIATLILEHYATSLVALSDLQAPYILTFSEAALRRGWAELREQVLGCYFGTLIESHGVIARPDLSGAEAFHFMVGMSQGAENVEYRFRANPLQLLTSILIAGASLGIDAEWDPEFRALDHKSGYVFVPTNYRSFAEPLMQAGTNFGFEIGSDVWTVNDFREFSGGILRPAVGRSMRVLSPESSALALAGALLSPDRLPLHIVDWDAVATIEQEAPAAQGSPTVEQSIPD